MARAGVAGCTSMASDDPFILDDLSDDAPAGENLEFDPEFGELDRAAQDKPETQYGDTITPGEPPDWKEMQKHAVSLLTRTRDLRVLTHLAIARLHLSGLPAFAEVLSQIRHQLEERWEQVHPQLDPEDDNDPTLRANALFRLRDPKYVLRALREVPLATTPQSGPVSWRDIAIFRGLIEPDSGRDRPPEALIRGAFAKTNPERLAITREAADRAVREVAAIQAAFDTHAGYGNGPDFNTAPTNLRETDNLSGLVREIQREIRNFEPAAAPGEMAEDSPEVFDEQANDTAPAAMGGRSTAARGPVNIRAIGALNTREDAIFALELASGYFRSNEPSSPLPMLIDRALRLSTMDFMNILRDLAPDGLGQAQVVAGPPPE